MVVFQLSVDASKFFGEKNADYDKINIYEVPRKVTVKTLKKIKGSRRLESFLPENVNNLRK